MKKLKIGSPHDLIGRTLANPGVGALSFIACWRKKFFSEVQLLRNKIKKKQTPSFLLGKLTKTFWSWKTGFKKFWWDWIRQRSQGRNWWNSKRTRSSWPEPRVFLFNRGNGRTAKPSRSLLRWDRKMDHQWPIFQEKNFFFFFLKKMFIIFKIYTSLINFLPPLKSLEVSRKKNFRGGYCFCFLPKTKNVNLDCLGHKNRSLKHFV